MTTTTPKKAVVGRLPCGCITAALIPGFDTPTNDKREIPRVIAGRFREAQA